jgi:hypothetical protein
MTEVSEQVDVSQYEAAIEELAADKKRLTTLDSYRREHIAALQRELESLRTHLENPSASEQESPAQSSS